MLWACDVTFYRRHHDASKICFSRLQSWISQIAWCERRKHVVLSYNITQWKHSHSAIAFYRHIKNTAKVLRNSLIESCLLSSSITCCCAIVQHLVPISIAMRLLSVLCEGGKERISWNAFLIPGVLHFLIKSISPSFSLLPSFFFPASLVLSIPLACSLPCTTRRAAVDWWWEKSPKDRRLVKDRPACSVSGSKPRRGGWNRGDYKERSTLIFPCCTSLKKKKKKILFPHFYLLYP